MKTAVLASLSVALLAVAGQGKPISPEGQGLIGKWVSALGDDDFETRELAERVLRRIGPPALAALREAAAASKDAEVRSRAARLARVFEVDAVAGILSAPRKVRLTVKGLSPSEAVASLAKASGYTIRIRGEAPAQKVTLDTGEVTFWEALDALGRAAGLREVSARAPSASGRGMEAIELEAGAEAPTCRFGSVRVRALPGKPGDVGPGLILNIQPEPRLRDFRVQGGSLKILRAVDDNGVGLGTVLAPEEPPRVVGGLIIGGKPLVIPPPATAQRSAAFFLRPGPKPSKTLRELKGEVAVLAEAETGVVATILSPLTTKEKAVSGRGRWGLRLLSIKQDGDGAVHATVSVSRPSSNLLEAMFGGKIRGRVNINGVEVGGESERATPAYPRLYDAEGREYSLSIITAGAVREDGPIAERRSTIKYTPPGPKSAPARMSLSAIEVSPLVVPFTITDIEIP
jgi:hypothetical protein